MDGFTFNDGGRVAAGFKGHAGDCVARAVAIASGRPYREVYDRLAQGNAAQRVTKRSKKSTAGRATARDGINTRRQWFKDYMAELGFRWVPTMKIGSGCTVHLDRDELPAGRLVVMVSRHATAMVDGIIHDTYDPRDRGATIYPANYLGNIPIGAVRRDDGSYVYEPRRCVYGFWQLDA